jgi:ABC-type uncharacterized transport system involved in gliding motility auxiliary subunit
VLYGLAGVAALIFVPLIVTSSRWLRASRVDLTTDQLYTLTPGTLQIIDTLQRPLKLTLYFSDHATRDLPQLRSYEQRVREMLQEMVARSHGRIRLQVIDPVPYSDDEASAEGSGLTAAMVAATASGCFLVWPAAPNVSTVPTSTAMCWKIAYRKKHWRFRSSIRPAKRFSNTTSPSCCTN